MKDIDFDELDKAVNSLMTANGAAPNEQLSEPPTSSKTVVPDNSSPSVTVARKDAPSVVAEDSPAPVSIPVRPAPAIRRSGRFMDMVSTPAVDNKPRPTPVEVTTPTREGLSITPRAEANFEQPAVDTPQPSDDTEPEHADESMPDPIDVVFETEPATKSETIEQPPIGATESPFLTDAKVEKRPLNADVDQVALNELANEIENDEPAEQASVEVSDDDNDEPPAVPKVPELDSNLVAIESTEKVESVQPVDVPTADAVAPAVPLGATSIAQQYQPKESSGDQSHAAIYDASQYPEPVSHPANGKSGWLWVVWVVVLLAIGAGGAILLYNLGIIP